MTMSHNQMAYVAIVSTLIFGSLFVGATGLFQTSSELGDFDDDVVTPRERIRSKRLSNQSWCPICRYIYLYIYIYMYILKKKRIKTHEILTFMGPF